MIIFLIFILMIIFINSNLKNSFSMNISNQDINFSAVNQSIGFGQRLSSTNLQELNNFFYLKYNNVSIPISFVTEKNSLNNIIYIKDKKLILLLNPPINSNNNLVIQIPRNILDSKTTDNKDSNFTVLINNEAAKFSEITDKKFANNSTKIHNRELSIKFGKDTKVIEIEGSNLYKIKIENNNNNNEINTNFQKIFPILYGNNKKYLFYNIEGGFLKDINLKQQSLKNKTLNLFIDTYDSRGNLVIQIPRNILDSKTTDNKDSNFTVLINNEAAKFSEITDKKFANNSTKIHNRELSIKFGKDTKVIEIEGSNLYKNTNHNSPKKIPPSKAVPAILLEIPIISICIFIIIIILYKKKIWDITKTFEIIKKSIKNRESITFL